MPTDRDAARGDPIEVVETGFGATISEFVKAPRAHRLGGPNERPRVGDVSGLPTPAAQFAAQPSASNGSNTLQLKTETARGITTSPISPHDQRRGVIYSKGRTFRGGCGGP
jgi:hypothetical protein